MADNPRNRPVRPPRLVLATVGGVERQALLSYWQHRDDGRWWGFVAFTTDPGMQYLRWTPDVRPAHARVQDSTRSLA